MEEAEILKRESGNSERRWSSRRRSCATPRVGVVDDQSQDCGQDAVPGTPVTVIVMNALYGVLGLLSSIYYSRPALRHYLRYITWMHRWVRQPPVTSVGEETTSVVSQGGSEVVKHNNSYHPLHNSQDSSCHRKLSPLGPTTKVGR